MSDEGRKILHKDIALQTEEWDDEDIHPLSCIVIDKTKLFQNTLCNSEDKKRQRKVRQKITYLDSHSDEFDDSGWDKTNIKQNLFYNNLTPVTTTAETFLTYFNG